jgi:hypothetical protein
MSCLPCGTFGPCKICSDEDNDPAFAAVETWYSIRLDVY